VFSRYLPSIPLLPLVKAFDISAFVDDGALAAVSVLFVGYGVALVPFCYMASIPFTKHWSAQIYTVLFCIFVGLILMIASFVMSLIESTDDTNDTMMYFYYLLPPFALGRGLFQICLGRFIDVFLEYDDCRKSLPGYPNALDDAQVQQVCSTVRDLYHWKVTGGPICYMFLTPILFMGIVLAFEMYLKPYFRANAKLSKFVDRAPPPLLPGEAESDVLAEEVRMANHEQERDIVKINKVSL
jgi:hypothetical protein